MYQRLSFAGVSVPSGAAPPAYDELLESHGRTDLGGFDQLLDTLDAQFSVEDRPAFYGSATDKGALPANNYKVLVNPLWEGRDSEEIPGEREDAVWNIPTDGYATVAHDEPLSQLREAVVERYDPSAVFGVSRLRQGGAEIHTDLFTHADTMDGLDADEDIYLGISTGHDYKSTTRLYVDVVALMVSEGSARILRYLIDPRRRKHTGDAEDDVVEWYGDALDRLDRVSDKLYRVIGDAMNYTIDLSEYPCGTTDWFNYLGLPDTRNDLATPAAGRLNALTPPGSQPTAWHAYKAGMSAIESKYDSRDTSAYKNHVTTVNTLLFNPSLAEKQVLSSVEEDIVESREDDDEDITDWADSDEEDPLETVRTRAKSISEGVAEFESTKERVRALLNDEGTEEAHDTEPARVEADD